MEGRLVNVDDISQWLSHDSPCDPLGELLLCMHQLSFSIHLRAVDDLRFPVGSTVLNIDLADQPGRERWQLQLLLPEGCSLLKRHMPLQE